MSIQVNEARGRIRPDWILHPGSRTVFRSGPQPVLDNAESPLKMQGPNGGHTKNVDPTSRSSGLGVLGEMGGHPGRPTLASAATWRDPASPRREAPRDQK